MSTRTLDNQHRHISMRDLAGEYGIAAAWMHTAVPAS
jgi:hypothetical protein